VDPHLDTERRELERWFRRRGLPHFVEHDEPVSVMWGRAFWLLVVASFVRGLGALDVAGYTLGENVAAAAIVVVVLGVTWVVANRVRRRPSFAKPDRIGGVELVLFLFAPAIPAALFGQWRDAAEAVVGGVAVLLVIYGITSYGIVPLLGWAGGRAIAQLAVLANLAVRALPLLLLFMTFLFINAEVWQVAGTLHGVVYAAVLAIFFLLGSVFVLSRVPSLMRSVAEVHEWDEITALIVDTPAAELPHPTAGRCEPDPLTLRQRLNIGLVTIFNQAIQVTLVVLVLTAFFVLFGFLAIPEATTAGWTTLADVDVLLAVSVDGQELVVTGPLLRVAGFLGAFSGMYFTVVLSTDATYRDEFADDVAPGLREALAARAVYGQRDRIVWGEVAVEGTTDD
jgi:hypothetical protein